MLLIVIKTGRECCRLLSEDTEEIEATPSLAAAKEISLGAAVEAVLAEPDGILTRTLMWRREEFAQTLETTGVKVLWLICLRN